MKLKRILLEIFTDQIPRNWLPDNYNEFHLKDLWVILSKVAIDLNMEPVDVDTIPAEWKYENYNPNIVKILQIKDLIFTQNYADLDGIFKPKTKGPVSVIYYKEKYYLIDGHHRVVNRILDNEKTIKCEIQNK